MRTRSSLLWALLLGGAVLCALAPALREPGLLSHRYDWRYFETMSEIARRSVVWHGQAPLWNPYSCGGEVDLANPQSLSAAPTFLLVLLFGTAAGIKLSLLAYYLLGLGGAYLLARRLGASSTGAALAAAGFGLSGYQALHLSAGHLNFAGVCLYPLLLYSYDRALDEIEWAIPAGLLAAWVAALGGTFTPPMAGLLLAFWGAAAAIGRRSARPLLVLVLCVAVALLCGAARSLPALEFIADHPRPPFRRRVADVSAPWHVLLDLTAWRSFGPVEGRRYWSHEYAARLPYALLPLAAVGLALVRRLRPARWLAALGLFSLLLSMGHFSPVAPWPLLQHLPVLSDLRVPSRFEVLLVLSLALLGGLGWDALAPRLRRSLGERGAAALGVALAIVVAADGALYTAQQFQGSFGAVVSAPPGPVPFYHIESAPHLMRTDVFAGHGVLKCDEEAPLQKAEALDPGAVPQERLLDPAAGEVVASRWSPGRRDVTVELRRPTLLLINSNWNEHFRAAPAHGTKVTQVAGRLAVDLAGLPPGRHTVTVRYAPRSFFAGAALTALCLPGALLLFLWARRRRAAR